MSMRERIDQAREAQYTDEQILDAISQREPEMGARIVQAREAGYDAPTIINSLYAGPPGTRTPAPGEAPDGGVSGQFAEPAAPEGPREYGMTEVPGAALRNAPGSLLEMGKSIWQAIRHPVQTTQGMSTVGASALNRMVPEGSGRGYLGTPEDKKRMFEQAAAQPGAISPPDVFGGREITDEQAEALAGFFVDRYGGWENVKRTMAEDPAGMLSDAAVVLSGGGALVSKMPRMARAGQTMKAMGQAIEPVSMVLNTPKLAKRGLAKIVKPERLMESTIKPSTVEKSGVVAKRVRTAIDEGILPSQKGLDKLNRTVWELQNKVDDIITTNAQAGDAIPTAGLVKALDNLEAEYLNLPDPKPYIQRIRKVKKALVDNHGESMPVDKAQAMKREIYKVNSQAYDNALKIQSKMESVSTATEKEVARAIMKELEGLYPELKGLNKRSGALLDLQKDLERAVNRIENRNILSLNDLLAAGTGGTVAGGKGAGIGGLVQMVTGSPRIKARLAIVLDRALKTPLRRSMVPAAAFQAGRIGRMQEEPDALGPMTAMPELKGPEDYKKPLGRMPRQ